MSPHSFQLRLLRVAFRLLIALAAAIMTVSAMDVTYVGSIEDSLSAPTSLAVTSDRIAVLEPFIKQLKIYTPEGVIRQQVNITGWASGLAALSQNEYLFCDRAARRVILVDVASRQQRAFSLSSPPVDPIDLQIANNRLYILDAGREQVWVGDTLGNPIQTFGLTDNENRPVGFGQAIAVDAAHDRLYILDQLRSEVRVFDTEGKYLSTFGSFGNADGDITRGGDLFCDSRGAVLVSDRFQSRIAVYNRQGRFLSNIRLEDLADSRLRIPTGLAVDEQGILYVASTESARIHLFHIDFDASDVEALVAVPVSPEPNAIVTQPSVTLAVQLGTTIDTAAEYSADFELYLAEDSVQPVAQAAHITPDALVHDTRAVVIEWVPNLSLLPDTLYRWRARVQHGGQTGDWSALSSFRTAALPIAYLLHQNYPNPFNPQTHIAFSLPEQSQVTITVVNILGQTVTTLVDAPLPAGEHSVMWNGLDENGRPVASGVYFYRMKAGTFVEAKKMVLLK